jgi:hypothetical protein
VTTTTHRAIYKVFSGSAAQVLNHFVKENRPVFLLLHRAHRRVNESPILTPHQIARCGGD